MLLGSFGSETSSTFTHFSAVLERQQQALLRAVRPEGFRALHAARGQVTLAEGIFGNKLCTVTNICVFSVSTDDREGKMRYIYIFLIFHTKNVYIHCAGVHHQFNSIHDV